ncbi:2-amino-4-hydroxy-6-hydroxymethyldihydropteridine diphosphokinase [Clostridium magnum]|uniref:Bifunctional folate synthesis protein n=1 Tax=Clostridium magnum DSM 2767 TaxID=1121326 RepID=A0A161YHQ2_9CLOT|nr:2-amino-4-hydroxy-6-hydroxymethyldihydropteridine diphosphokinase [Clostridium magnum]KZL89792.1 bifunctional folate synthesis protein [Clostridium magnum DSM 2767]SHJ66894.1 dihydroneopterin aldolase / 2-amino-4-hydroxy-6-hydroxymethyldihydropteridine diphosphokinase [Clostridium magnum DSM 2767]
MDKIYIKDLEIYGFHGVNQQEKDMGQRFLVSLELFLSLQDAGESDDLDKTVSYAQVCIDIEEEFKKEKYDLIEKAAEKLAEFVLINYELVDRVKIKIKKPWAPIGKPLDHVSVEIDRKWHTAYIAIGSNMGDKEKNLNSAIELINNPDFNRVIKVSNFYETKPVGYLEQEEFLNGALEIKTLLSPKRLMRFLLEKEEELKRERIIKWGPRTIDLDILLYDNLITSEEEIIIPHPRMHERLFVLIPLLDIAPYVIHPILNKRVIELANMNSEDGEL